MYRNFSVKVYRNNSEVRHAYVQCFVGNDYANVLTEARRIAREVKVKPIPFVSVDRGPGRRGAEFHAMTKSNTGIIIGEIFV